MRAKRVSCFPCRSNFKPSRLSDVDFQKYAQATQTQLAQSKVVKVSALPWKRGDLDAGGFRILAAVRRVFPQVKSLLMDLPTFELYRHRAVVESDRQFEVRATLTEPEYNLSQYLAQENLRLEQDALRDSHVNAEIRRVLG